MYYNENPENRYNLQPNVKSVIGSYFVEASTWLYLTIGVGVALLIILLLVLVFRKRISIAIAVIKEGSK
jgi:LPXTG-motif cell wall-anchored protein